MPIAERVKCSTIIILVKEVSIIRMEGGEKPGPVDSGISENSLIF